LKRIVFVKNKPGRQGGYLFRLKYNALGGRPCAFIKKPYQPYLLIETPCRFGNCGTVRFFCSEKQAAGCFSSCGSAAQSTQISRSFGSGIIANQHL